MRSLSLGSHSGPACSSKPVNSAAPQPLYLSHCLVYVAPYYRTLCSSLRRTSTDSAGRAKVYGHQATLHTAAIALRLCHNPDTLPLVC